MDQLMAQMVPANGRRRGCIRGKCGFSLIEVMIGMTIVGMVLVSCLMSLPEVRELAYRSDDLDMAYTELNSAFETLRTRTFDQLSESITTTGHTNATAAALLGVSASGKVAVTSTTVTHNDVSYEVNRYLAFDDGDSEIIQALVEVDWTASGRGQSATGRSIFAKNGLSDKKFGSAN